MIHNIKTFYIIKYTMRINSISGLSQYKIGGRILTIFGEYHDDRRVCDGATLSISEFCEMRVGSNKDVRFLLEYNDNMMDEQCKVYGSEPVRHVFNSDKKSPMRLRTTGVDLRLDYLTMLQQQSLYHRSVGFSPRDFALIYSSKKSIGPVLDHTVCGEYKELLDQYILGVDKFFKDHRDDGSLLNMQWGWSFLMDYRILWEFTRTDIKSNEMIAVVGENHRYNLNEVLTSWNVEKIGENDKCVNVTDVVVP